MACKITRISPNIKTFLAWDESDVVSIDTEEYSYISDEIKEKLQEGMLSREEMSDLYDLLCEVELWGGIMYAPTEEDAAKLDIHTLSDIHRVLGENEEEILEARWRNQCCIVAKYNELSNNDKEQLVPDLVWAGRCGKYVLLGYGWRCCDYE